MHTENVFFDGLAGKIECAIDWPDTSPIGWALCLHPHPLFDGTNTNKVVTTLARACVQHGLVALRPNFRGVGQSEGNFDHAHGETLDMLALVEQFLATHTEFQGMSWVLGGFSFGTAVAAQLYAEIEDRVNDQESLSLPTQLILLGPGVWRFSYREVTLPSDTLLVHGEKDDVIPLADAYTWLKDRQLPITVIPDSGHFFHGKLVMLKAIIQKQLRLMRG
ncbi:alpha/beta hydrolase [Pelistega europaea]|uniref:Alpha/beta hydrolase n=1 Tax=Pelistega europaea TaxID=106147 RepID=A0A7Y4L809_9BURK|nr:alpha/beta hydrolase [Pelistega europaea]NOL48680.1 alpha/beta hydrolase [Pelistega europaea]